MVSLIVVLRPAESPTTAQWFNFIVHTILKIKPLVSIPEIGEP
jgi:hypothetical protein